MSEFERKAKLFFSLINLEGIEDSTDEEIKEGAEFYNNTEVRHIKEACRLRGWLDFIFWHSEGKAREWAEKALGTQEEKPEWDNSGKN